MHVSSIFAFGVIAARWFTQQDKAALEQLVKLFLLELQLPDVPLLSFAYGFHTGKPEEFSIFIL